MIFRRIIINQRTTTKTIILTSSIVHNKFEFNLDEDIKEPSYYRNLIEVLNNATEQDLVVLNINSGGGMLDSAISIIDSLRNTRANTLAWISGSAYSAAGLRTPIVTECGGW